MNSKILLSAACGLAAILSIVSVVAIHLFPDRDLPMMPKPFFFYALAPGILAREMLSRPQWMRQIVFFGVNTAISIPVFCGFAVVDASKKAHDGE